VSRSSLAIVVLIQFAALIAVCLLVGDNGWDDGAITLAFSRTFAQHGRVALTPHSEVVEGFSSVAWFLLNAPAALATSSYRALILVSQLLAALCICASTLLLARTCRLVRLDRFFTTLTVIAFAAWGCSFSEASNGMEMGLLAAAVLVMVNELARGEPPSFARRVPSREGLGTLPGFPSQLSPRPRTALLALGVVVAVTTRFEAAVYVGLLALSVASVPGRRAFWTIVIASLGTVALLSAWRLSVFSDLLPNTYWAKRWPPYAAFDLVGRLRGAVELPSLFLAPLIALVIVRRRGGVEPARRRGVLILALPILGAILVGGLIGKAWGYYGRMPFFAVPLALVLMSLLFSSWVDAKRSSFRVAVAVGAFVVSTGLSMSGFPSGSLAAAFKGGSFGVTPHTYAQSGQVFRRFAAAADLQQPTILTPDLGGLALCCDEFRIVDLALLSNRPLARRGQAALAEVLENESPHLVEAHWKWASAGTFYELPYFRAHYLPAFAGGTKLWIRGDVAEAIERKGRGCRLPTNRGDVQAALRAHRYADHDLPEDRAAFDRRGIVFTPDPCP